MPDEKIAESLKKSLRLLTFATIALYVVVIVVTVFVYIDAANRREDLEREAVRTTNALCTFREDLERRVQTSREFLRNNPEGIPGISPADLKRSITNQQLTVEALSELECKD